MFFECYNLIYINFQNAIELDSLFVNETFNYTPDNIIYCINESSAPKINYLLATKTCSKKDCSLNWREKNKSLIKYSNYSKCINFTFFSI